MGNLQQESRNGAAKGDAEKAGVLRASSRAQRITLVWLYERRRGAAIAACPVGGRAGK